MNININDPDNRLSDEQKEEIRKFHIDAMKKEQEKMSSKIKNIIDSISNNEASI